MSVKRGKGKEKNEIGKVKKGKWKGKEKKIK